RVPAAVDLGEVPVDAINVARQRHGVEVDPAIAVAFDHRHVAVVEVHDLPGVREDRGRVGREEVLAVSDADEQRASLPRRDDLARIAARNHGDALRALDLAQRVDHRLLERAVEQLLHEVRDHFGIRVGAEDVPEVLQRIAEHAGVLDDPVVHDGHAAVGAQVRMRVALVRRTVRRPARVPDADHPVHRVGGDRRFELRDLSRRAADPDRLAVPQRDARGIVAAILHAPQPLYQQRRRLSRPDVSYDSAHGVCLYLAPYESVASSSRPRSTSFCASTRVGASAMTRTTGSVPEGRMCTQRSCQSRRIPSCISASASGKAAFSAAYTVSSGASGLASLSLMIAYRGAPATTAEIVRGSSSIICKTSATPSGASRPRCSSGRMTPPFPSPPITAFSARMRSATFTSPTGARITRWPCSAAASSTTRLV